MNYINILLEKTYSGKIWIIKLNRENSANAIDKLTADELQNVFESFENDSISCIAILSGQGKYFCSGADLKEVNRHMENFVNSFGKSSKEVIRSNMNTISEKDAPLGISRMLLKKPVIAAISGPAVAGGLELALWCDMRVSYKDCSLGVYCRRYGVPLIDGGSYRLSALIGLSRAMDLILTGREIKGEEAYQIGLVNRIVERQENVLQEALNLAQILCGLPQICMRNDRLSLIENSYNLNIKNLIENEYNHGIKSLISGEAIKGSKLFTQGQGKSGKPVLLPKF
jgi:enoyl-CoA hydratase